jgi:ubiquinol-cytochrome c reductase cytochrome c1 subunit
MRRARLAAAFGVAVVLASPAFAVEDETPQPPPVKWSFSGPFGTYDKAQLQRGFQVYNEVCSSCHSMKLLSYRNLEEIGLTAAQVKTIAATKTVPGEPNSDGQPTTRPALPSDRFASPFPNDQAARAANNGALPPDQSDLEKAREGGSNYIHALMIGYVTAPADFKVPDGSYYNLYFPGQKIHMPPPLSDGAVTYADGTKATVDQMGKDVAAFLTWASNPEMDARKHMGVRMVGFFALLAGVTYGVKRKIWADIH